MARIRSIKPEFFVSEQIVECSTSARLLFVGLWCHCDDAGRHVASIKRLRAEVFPCDPCTDSDVSGWVAELIKQGLVVEYSAQSQRYWQVTGWSKHQKIDRPTIKYPGPFDEESSSTRRALDDPSTTDGNGVESKGSIKQTNKQTNKREGCGLKDLEWTPHAEASKELATSAFLKVWTDEQRRKLKPEDKELLLKASLLAVAAPTPPYSRGWFDGVMQAAEKCKRRKGGAIGNPGGYLQTCFRESATKAGRDWPSDLASLESVIPPEVINGRNGK